MFMWGECGWDSLCEFEEYVRDSGWVGKLGEWGEYQSLPWSIGL